MTAGRGWFDRVPVVGVGAALTTTMVLAVTERDAPAALGVSVITAAVWLLRDFRPDTVKLEGGGVKVEASKTAEAAEQVRKAAGAVVDAAETTALTTSRALRAEMLSGGGMETRGGGPRMGPLPGPPTVDTTAVRERTERLIAAASAWGYLQGASGFWAAPPQPVIRWNGNEPEILAGVGDTAERRPGGQSSEASR